MKEMEIGQLVDYCVTYNKAHGVGSETDSQDEEKVTVRKATAADWDNMWG